MRGCFYTTIFSALLIAGCNYDIAKNPGDGQEKTTGANDTLPATAAIDWPLMQTKVLNDCATCHSGLQLPNLSSWSQVQDNISKVFQVVSSGFMPPANQGYAHLSKCKLAALKKWMDLGEPQTTPITVSVLPECPPPISSAPTLPVLPIQAEKLSYQVLLTRILQPKCMRCHNPDSKGDVAKVLFFPHAQLLKDTARWGAPGAQSRIVRILSRTDDRRMPPPKRSPPLSAEEIDYVTRYIDAGLPQ